MSDIMRWSLHRVPATKAPKMLERRDGMWVLFDDHEKAILKARKEAYAECANLADGYGATWAAESIALRIREMSAIRSKAQE